MPSATEGKLHHSHASAKMIAKLSDPTLYPNLTAEQEGKIDALLRKADAQPDLFRDPSALLPLPHDDGKNTTHSNRRIWALTFLQARLWNMDKAYAMLEAVSKFRKERDIWRYNILPSAIDVRGYDQEQVIRDLQLERRPKGDLDTLTAAIGRHFGLSIHYWDKSGLPIVYLQVGTVDEPGLLRELKKLARPGQTIVDVMWEYVVHAVSIGEVLCFHQQLRIHNGELNAEGITEQYGLVHAADIVVNTAGLNYKMLWKPALDLFRGVLQRVFLYYPEAVHRFVVINCPNLIMIAYNIVKSSFTDDMQRKITFHTPQNTLDALSAFIDVRYVPYYWGGECRCADDCVPRHDPKRLTMRDGAAASSADGDGEEVTLKPGETISRCFELDTDETVTWEYNSAHLKSIVFDVYFIPNVTTVDPAFTSLSEKEWGRYTWRPGEAKHTAGSFTAPQRGVLIIAWNNKASWLRSRTVQLRVHKESEESRAYNEAAADSFAERLEHAANSEEMTSST